MNKPHRAYAVTVKVEGDDWESAMRALRVAADEVATHGPACQSIMGGPNSSHIITVEHDPAMTHDGYIDALQGALR